MLSTSQQRAHPFWFWSLQKLKILDNSASYITWFMTLRNSKREKRISVAYRYRNLSWGSLQSSLTSTWRWIWWDVQYVKCGFAGDNFPTAVFPCMVGRPMLRYEEDLGEQELKVVLSGRFPNSSWHSRELNTRHNVITELYLLRYFRFNLSWYNTCLVTFRGFVELSRQLT